MEDCTPVLRSVVYQTFGRVIVWAPTIAVIARDRSVIARDLKDCESFKVRQVRSLKCLSTRPRMRSN
jgi:hypothetical protein